MYRSYLLLAVFAGLVDHILELSLGGVLAEGSHHRAQLLGGDGAISVLTRAIRLLNGGPRKPKKGEEGAFRYALNWEMVNFRTK